MGNKYKKTVDGKKAKNCNVGEFFEIVVGNNFSVGSIVQLERDDGSASPLFKLTSGGTCRYNNAEGRAAGAYEFYSSMRAIEPPLTKDSIADVKFTVEEVYWIWQLFGSCSGNNTYKLYAKAGNFFKIHSIEEVDVNELKLGQFEDAVDKALAKVFGEKV